MDHELLGLTAYEAKVYRALLAQGPLTAYAAGKAAAVPLSRVYEVVARLAEKGFARCLEGEPARYEAAPHQQVVEEARRRLRQDLDTLASELASVAQPDAQPERRSLRGMDQVLQAVRTASSPGAVIVAGPGARQVAAAAAGAGASVLPGSEQDAAGDDGFVLICADGLLVAGSVAAGGSAVALQHALLHALAARGLARPARRAAQSAGATPRRPDTGRAWIDWEAQKQHRLLGRRPS